MTVKTETTHSCDAMKDHEAGHFGAAIEEIWERADGSWQAMGGMNKYFSTIKFCPFCGVRLGETAQ